MTRSVPLTKTMVQVATIAVICLGVFAFVLVTVNADTHSPTLQATHGVQTDYGFMDDGYEFTITGKGWDPAADGTSVVIGCSELGTACPQYICTPGMGCDPKYFVVMASDGSFSFPLFGQGAAPGPYQISASQGTNCAYVSNGAGTHCTLVTASTTVTVPVAGAYTTTVQTTTSQPLKTATAAQQPKTVSTGGTPTTLAIPPLITSAEEGVVAAAIGGLASLGVATAASHLTKPTEELTPVSIEYTDSIAYVATAQANVDMSPTPTPAETQAQALQDVLHGYGHMQQPQPTPAATPKYLPPPEQAQPTPAGTSTKGQATIQSLTQKQQQLQDQQDQDRAARVESDRIRSLETQKQNDRAYYQRRAQWYNQYGQTLITVGSFGVGYLPVGKAYVAGRGAFAATDAAAAAATVPYAATALGVGAVLMAEGQCFKWLGGYYAGLANP